MGFDYRELEEGPSAILQWLVTGNVGIHEAHGRVEKTGQ